MSIERSYDWMTGFWGNISLFADNKLSLVPRAGQTPFRPSYKNFLEMVPLWTKDCTWSQFCALSQGQVIERTKINNLSSYWYCAVTAFTDISFNPHMNLVGRGKAFIKLAFTIYIYSHWSYFWLARNCALLIINCFNAILEDMHY